MTPEAIARRIVEEGVAPTCTAGWAARGAGSSRGGIHGWNGGWMHEVGGATDVLFDLASVTKPMTAVAFARAGIDRRTPLGDLLAEARGTPSERVSLELLLAHRAGLESHRSLYAPLFLGERVDVPAALRDAANARRPDAAGDGDGDAPEEGFPPLYSDLGYALAGAALARATGAADAGAAIDRLVLVPLGLTGCAGTIRDLEAAGTRGPFAPTEDAPWRGGRIVGAVHDENAWALTGAGGSGHAGIFGRVEAVLAFGAAILDALEGQGPFAGTDLSWLVRERPGGSLRAGFDGKSPEGSSAGAVASPRSFGHLGFVGTSLWIDPDAHAIVTLLTNRVFYGRDHVAIRSARPWAHDGLWTRAHEISEREP